MEINATLVVQLVVFLLLLSWLSTFLFKPMMRLFDEREKRIDGAKREAEHMQVEAHARLMSIEEQIRHAQQEARQELVALKEEAAAYQRQLLEKSRQDAKTQLETARAELETHVEKTRQALIGETSELSALVLKRVLGASGQPAGNSSSGNKMECSNA